MIPHPERLAVSILNTSPDQKAKRCATCCATCWAFFAVVAAIVVAQWVRWGMG